MSLATVRVRSTWRPQHLPCAYRQSERHRGQPALWQHRTGLGQPETIRLAQQAAAGALPNHRVEVYLRKSHSVTKLAFAFSLQVADHDVAYAHSRQEHTRELVTNLVALLAGCEWW